MRVCRMALAAFGGTVGVARALWECHRSAEPRSPTAARVLLGIANLHRIIAPSPLDYARMDDADLNERVERLHRKLYGKD
jgi:hypothetical protein